MRSSSRLLVPALTCVLALGALAFAILAGKASSPSGGTDAQTAAAPSAGGGAVVLPSTSAEFDGAALPAGILAPAFTLQRVGGGDVSLASLRGRPVLLTFLYSRCGAACVLIAQQIRGALDELPPGAAHAVIVSAAPSSDSVASVRAFLAQVGLSHRAEWLTGSLAKLRSVWRAYRVRPASAGSAAFAKYATVLLIDASGHERVLYGSEQLTPEALAHDVRRVDEDPARSGAPGGAGGAGGA